jgi:hypothetical protein
MGVAPKYAILESAKSNALRAPAAFENRLINGRSRSQQNRLGRALIVRFGLSAHR